MLGKKVLRIVTVILLLTAISGSILFYITYEKNRSYLDLLSNLPPKSADDESPPPSNLNEENLTTEYLELLSDIVDTEVLVVSTGKLSDSTIKGASGEVLGNATVLDVVAKDSKGDAENLQIIVQIFLKSDPSNDLIPWLANIASFTKGLEEYSDNPKTYSLDELFQIFNENSVWLITPLVDFDAHKGLFAQKNQEYVFFARQYYGEGISAVKEFIENSFEKIRFDSPLLLMTIEWVK